MGFRFTLVLSREISDEESAVLRGEPGCADAVFAADSLPTNAEVPVTRVDVDDCVSVSLEAAIEAGFAAVQKVSGLSVPGLTVPAQPAFRPDAESGAVVQGSVIEETATADPAADPAAEDGPVADEPTVKKTTVRKSAAKKASAKKASPEKIAAEPASD